jgi:hypothetical protein
MKKLRRSEIYGKNLEEMQARIARRGHFTLRPGDEGYVAPDKEPASVDFRQYLSAKPLEPFC